jgi:hypothetical protein
LGGELQLVVLLLMVVLILMSMLLMLLLVEVLHVGFLQLLVLVGGRILQHLLADIEMLLVGRLAVSLWVR